MYVKPNVAEGWKLNLYQQLSKFRYKKLRLYLYRRCWRRKYNVEELVASSANNFCIYFLWE